MCQVRLRGVYLTIYSRTLCSSRHCSELILQMRGLYLRYVKSLSIQLVSGASEFEALFSNHKFLIHKWVAFQKFRKTKKVNFFFFGQLIVILFYILFCICYFKNRLEIQGMDEINIKNLLVLIKREFIVISLIYKKEKCSKLK